MLLRAGSVGNPVYPPEGFSVSIAEDFEVGTKGVAPCIANRGPCTSLKIT